MATTPIVSLLSSFRKPVVSFRESIHLVFGPSSSPVVFLLRDSLFQGILPSHKVVKEGQPPFQYFGLQREFRLDLFADPTPAERSLPP